MMVDSKTLEMYHTVVAGDIPRDLSLQLDIGGSQNVVFEYKSQQALQREHVKAYEVLKLRVISVA